MNNDIRRMVREEIARAFDDLAYGLYLALEEPHDVIVREQIEETAAQIRAALEGEQ